MPLYNSASRTSFVQETVAKRPLDWDAGFDSVQQCGDKVAGSTNDECDTSLSRSARMSCPVP